MSYGFRSTGSGYVVAVVATTAAVLLRWLFDPWMGNNFPFVTLFGAIAAAVWYGGYRPAFVAAALGLAACDYLFIEPRASFAIVHPGDRLGIVLYVFTCSIIIALGEAMGLAQRRTKDGRELLRVTLASIGDAVITTDTEARVTYMNAVAELLTGTKQHDAAGQPLDAVFRIVSAQTRKRVENPVTRALREGVIIGLANHTVLIAKDGTERPVDDSASPIRDSQGRILGCVLIFREFTDRRRAETERQRLNLQLHEQIQELQALLEILPVGVWMGDPACERITGNRFAFEMIRQPVGENALLTTPEAKARKSPSYKSVVDGQEVAVDDLPMQRAGRTGQPVRNEELDVVLDDGTVITLLCNVAPLLDGQAKVRAVVGAYADISDRKRMEQALRQSEGRVRSVVNTVVDGIITITAEGTIETINPAAERLFGYKVEEVIGTNVKVLMPNPYSHEHDGYIANYLRTGVAKIIGIGREVVGRRKDGSTFPMVLAVSEFPLDGRHHFTGIVRDITERKRTEAILKEADRRKDEFLATLAHELRNPLAPLRNALELLKQVDTDGPQFEQIRGMMERQVDHMVRLVDDLLDISRITMGKLQLRKEPLELADVLNTAIETARPLIEASAHELTVVMPPVPVHLHGDPTRLAQVFANLLNNAAKYTEKAGHIWLTAEHHDGEAVVSVRDTGIGIAADHLPDIFKIFSQVEPALARSQGGLGIGLSLVKGLVELHGGAIEARSDGLGKGSNFVVKLPIVESPLALKEAGDDDERARRVHKCRILVVDDLRDAADSLAMMLRLMGHDTRTAYDGLEAVHAATEFQPNVVLLDIGLPKINGYEAARRIRNEPWGGNLALVALTGWGQDEDKRRSIEAGFDHHLTKPVEREALEKLLANLYPVTQH